MSAECGTCGADIVYPVGTWPLGECPTCMRDERIRSLEEQLEAAHFVLGEIETFIASRHKEGDTEYQVALLARSVLNPASSPGGAVTPAGSQGSNQDRDPASEPEADDGDR